MKIYNIIGDFMNNIDKLYNVIRDCIKQDDGHVYNNSNCLMSINNNPVVAYINQKNVIHLLFLQQRDEYIIKCGNKSNGYKKELKFKDTVNVNIRMLMDSCFNIQAIKSNCYEDIIL